MDPFAGAARQSAGQLPLFSHLLCCSCIEIGQGGRQMIIHTVQPGETLRSIAQRYGVLAQQLLRDNGIPAGEPLVPGQTLVVLHPDLLHTVQPGDTLHAIARAYDVTVNELYRNNPGLVLQNQIFPGETLVIRYDQRRMGALYTGGYAYPTVDLELLRQTLPYMSYLMPFTYELTEEGGLRPPEDAPLVELALQMGVSPLLHLSNLREPYGFDSDVAHLVLADPSLQERLVEEVLSAIEQRGYLGVDLDFENIYGVDRLRYPQLIRRLHDRLSPYGYEVLVALAAKTSDSAAGPLVEGHDYQAVGEAADMVLLMTYEWGYREGPPMAVAPIGSVREVLDYAVTRIPPGKLLLGIPNYGYDWPLPFAAGETQARSLSNPQAVELARQAGVAIQYDSAAQAPWFRYWSGDTEHEVWFEDAKSIRAKLELVGEYGLRGVGYWNLMRPFPQNWRVLNALYEIEQRHF